MNGHNALRKLLCEQDSSSPANAMDMSCHSGVFISEWSKRNVPLPMKEEILSELWKASLQDLHSSSLKENIFTYMLFRYCKEKSFVTTAQLNMWCVAKLQLLTMAMQLSAVTMFLTLCC